MMLQVHIHCPSSNFEVISGVSNPFLTKIRWCRYTFLFYSIALHFFIFINILFFSPLLQSKILALLLDTGMFWSCSSTENPVRTKLSLSASLSLKFWVKPLSSFFLGSSSTHFKALLTYCMCCTGRMV